MKGARSYLKSYKYGFSQCSPCLYRWHKKKPCCILKLHIKRLELKFKPWTYSTERRNTQLWSNNVTRGLHHLLTWNKTLYPHAKKSHEIFSISRERRGGHITAKCAANLRLTECGSATLDEFSSSSPSLIGASVLQLHTFNNYRKCKIPPPNRLLLFIQTWSARWAGARFGIVVTVDQSDAINKEGTYLRTRRPMGAAFLKLGGVLLSMFGCLTEV